MTKPETKPDVQALLANNLLCPAGAVNYIPLNPVALTYQISALRMLTTNQLQS